MSASEKVFLCVDPGEKRIGLAISDPTGNFARPLQVLTHISRAVDAATIAQIGKDRQVKAIIVGQALDWDGQMGRQRAAQRVWPRPSKPKPKFRCTCGMKAAARPKPRQLAWRWVIRVASAKVTWTTWPR